MMNIGYAWFMRAVPGKGLNNAKIKMGFFVLFASYSGTLWWSSNKSRINELHAYSLQLDRAHLPQRKFVDFSIHFGEWGIPGGKKRMTGPDSQSSVQP